MEWFDARERRGILLFLPLMLLLALGLVLLERREARLRVRAWQREEQPLSADSIRLFTFDPNTISYDSLLMLGFSKSQALQLLKYRAAGKIYRLPEELDALYGMTDSLFDRIRPWIRIGEAYAYHPKSYSDDRFSVPPKRSFTPRGVFRIDTVSVAFVQSMGFSIRWSEAFVDCYRRREMRSLAELRELHFIGDSISDLLAPWIRFPEPQQDPFDAPIELNGADSAALRSVYGIGEKTVGRIIDYRRRLGGFYSVEQLAEVKGVTEANYEKILQQIWCDSFQIQKIDINFAPAERLREHPYIHSALLRKLISKRQQRKSKGGWSTVEEMVNDDILTNEEAQKLRPYLRFGTHPDDER